MPTACHEHDIASVVRVPGLDAEVPRQWIGEATAAQSRLRASLDDLFDRGELDTTADSRLPGWSIGHVITHIAQSGDGHLRMLDAAARGEVGRQYPGGFEQRESGIRDGVGRPASEQLADLRRGMSALEARWASMPTWEGTGTSMGGDLPITDLPFLRLREVAIHHIDLGLDATFDDLPEIYLREELRRMEMLWSARQPMGLTSLPPPALAAAPPARLAWLLGRADIPGLDPAHIY